MNQDKMMIEAQAALITKLNAQVADLRKKYDTACQWEPAARYYMNIQTLALEDEEIMEAWQEFLIVLKLRDHDAENKLGRQLRLP